MTHEELSRLLVDMYHIGGCDATDDAVATILVEFDAQAAEIERLQTALTALDEIVNFDPSFMPLTWEEIAVKLVTIARAARERKDGEG